MTSEQKAKIAALLPGIARDVATLSGLGCVSYGAWLVFPPAGFIVFGAIVLMAAVFGVPSQRA